MAPYFAWCVHLVNEVHSILAHWCHKTSAVMSAVALDCHKASAAKAASDKFSANLMVVGNQGQQAYRTRWSALYPEDASSG